ncbi:MAG: hypothetical protein JO001_10700 [Alphaproteobacteria bacterium]|nr:hypothetical protein [Alphaproteobacteria bacterium]
MHPSNGDKARNIGPYSRPASLGKLDGRTREAALMRRVRAELTDHVGGSPTAPQRLLIERAAILALRCAQIDAAILADKALSLHDNNHAIAWHNAYRRTIAALGPEPPPRPPSDPLAAIRALAGEKAA